MIVGLFSDEVDTFTYRAGSPRWEFNKQWHSLFQKTVLTGAVRSSEAC